MTETGHQPFTPRSDWWSRRPRRSRSDSKIAGVAGGLAHYLGVDPILFRVGFVALTILGGAGVLAYCLLWLLLPAEGDDVSAGEALIGRGRSSVSPVLAVALAIVVIISITSSFSWGLPFWPAAILAIIAFHIARTRRRGPFRPGSEWEQRFRNTQEAFTGNQWQGGHQQQQGYGPWQHHRHGPGGRSAGWGQWGCGSRGWADRGAPDTARVPADNLADDATSPFDTPAFWDGPTGSDRQGPAAGTATPQAAAAGGFPGFTKSPPAGTPGSNTTRSKTTASKTTGSNTAGSNTGGSSTTGSSTGSSSPGNAAAASLPPDPGSSGPEARTTPPAWDPLGVAPFAWDLPDIDLAPQSGRTLVKAQPASPVIARATMGTAVLAVAVQIIGIIAGWWALSWAAVSGTALAMVAIGLLVQSLRGRRITLVGPGILLSLVTVGLALTGLTGTASVGKSTWAPTSLAALQSSYQLSTGDAQLDLRNIGLAEGQTATTSVDVNAGQVTVILPADANVNVSCTGNVGRVDCVGNLATGLGNDRTFVDTNDKYTGTINLDVHVGAGNVVVSR